MEEKLIKMYGFYDEQNKLIDFIAKKDLADAIKWFKENNPDKKYLYVEVMY